LTLLVGRQEGHPACGGGVGVVVCLEQGADLHMAQLMPLPLTASLKSRLVLPFWYRLTWVVSDKGPLNGCVCVCVCVSTCIRHPYWGWPCWNFITDFTFIQKTPVRGLSCSIVCTMMACGRRMDRWTQIPCQHSFTLYKWKIARFDCDDYSLVVVWIMEGVCKAKMFPTYYTQMGHVLSENMAVLLNVLICIMYSCISKPISQQHCR